jgi:peptidoglycan-associated lipoprotein
MIQLSRYEIRLSLMAALILAGCAAKEAPQQAAVPPARPNRAIVPAATPRPQAPAGILAGSLRDFEINVGDQVFFAFDRADLDDAAHATLQKEAAWLAKYPAATVALQGNCDERGTREYNLALGARRAAAARDYLVSLGVGAARLTTISYGKERPVCAESNEACWSKNRRTVSAVANTVQSPNVAMR